MSASVTVAGSCPCAGGRSSICRRRLFFTHIPAQRHPSSSLATCTGRLPNVVRATTAGDGPVEESQPPSSPQASSLASGVGFGGDSDSVSSRSRSKGNKKNRVVVRREPVQKPLIQPIVGANSERQSGGELPQQEKAFLLGWLGLGFLILVEGIALAASGFLPEEWDSLFVKFLYPAFTPTVVFFLGGTVAYGVVKYLEAGKKS